MRRNNLGPNIGGTHNHSEEHWRSFKVLGSRKVSLLEEATRKRHEYFVSIYVFSQARRKKRRSRGIYAFLLARLKKRRSLITPVYVFWHQCLKIRRWGTYRKILHDFGMVFVLVRKVFMSNPLKLITMDSPWADTHSGQSSTPFRTQFRFPPWPVP